MRRHSLPVTDVAFHPDGATLATCSGDQTIKLWDTGNKKLLATLLGHDSGVGCIRFSPDGRLLVSSDDQELRIWDVTSRELKAAVSRPDEFLWCHSFQPDGCAVAVGGRGMIHFYDVANNCWLPSLTVDDRFPVRSIAFNSGGQKMAAVSQDGTVRLWDLREERRSPSTRAWTTRFGARLFPRPRTCYSLATDLGRSAGGTRSLQQKLAAYKPGQALLPTSNSGRQARFRHAGFGLGHPAMAFAGPTPKRRLLILRAVSLRRARH